MEPPKMSDFGLTQEDIIQNKNEHEYYEKVKKENYKNQEEEFSHKSHLYTFLGFASFVLLFIFMESCSDDSGGKGWLLFLTGATAVILILCGIHYFTAKPTEINKSEYIDQTIQQRIDEYERVKSEYNAYLLKVQEDFWKNLNGYEFEDEVGELYKKMGYIVKVTPKSGDGGIDLILRKDNQKIGVQCKHHSKPVGPNDVRAFIGVLLTQNYDSGIFISLNGFTATVNCEVIKSRNMVHIELISLPEILKMVEISNSNYDKKANTEVQTEQPISYTPKIYHAENINVKNKVVEPCYCYTYSNQTSYENDKERRVTCGKTVIVLDLEYNDIEKFIIKEKITNISGDEISQSSPVGKALMNHKIGEVVTINTPASAYRLKIINIL
jgi:hypothetical protein